jgi:hypothetical protein
VTVAMTNRNLLCLWGHGMSLGAQAVLAWEHHFLAAVAIGVVGFFVVLGVDW